MKDVSKMSDRELRVELRETRGLLAQAKCPNGRCESGRVENKLTPEDWSQCQWCAERSQLLAEGL